MPLKVAVLNQKGGVSKTTCVVHLATALARRGVRSLVVDLDAQVDASHWLWEHGKPTNGTIWDVFVDVRVGVGPFITPCAPNLGLVHGSREMGRIESIFSQVHRPLIMLRRALMQGVDDVDVVLIDCPPSVGRVALNACVAADEIIIPVMPDVLAREGMSMALTSLANITGDGGEIEQAPFIRVLFSCFDKRLVVARETMAIINEWQIPTFTSYIRPAATGKEAYGHRKTLFDYDPRGTIAADYNAFAEEFLQLHPALAPAVSQ